MMLNPCFSGISVNHVRKELSMMKLWSLLGRSKRDRMEYHSFASVESKTIPGVRFTILRMSFGRRMELMRRIRELARRIEFLSASQDPKEQMDAALAAGEVDKVYLLWGLQEVSGLELDGLPATPELLA